ncbi:hypothetical protein G3A43_39725 [Paraburkholderia aspalathi]|uniref:hypothetical protein n=1 Tax=Paraburkholderia nemoris TaxID=2793076 RepID=UPI00190BD401|nr:MULTISPECIES: hypothetical protein [Paraburkholderia]MBK3786335.1 hypothetical protein [Paraburkholderia aspalathi]
MKEHAVRKRLLRVKCLRIGLDKLGEQLPDRVDAVDRRITQDLAFLLSEIHVGNVVEKFVLYVVALVVRAGALPRIRALNARSETRWLIERRAREEVMAKPSMRAGTLRRTPITAPASCVLYVAVAVRNPPAGWGQTGLRFFVEMAALARALRGRNSQGQGHPATQKGFFLNIERAKINKLFDGTRQLGQWQTRVLFGCKRRKGLVGVGR